MMNKTDFPDILYKMRRGIAPYKRIDGDVYEDTTCNDHNNCRVRMKHVNDHYEICELLNKEANEHSWDQIRHEYDTHCYPKRSQCVREWYMNRINRIKEWQRECIEKGKKNTEKLATMTEMKERPQAIHRMDFGYPIFYAMLSCHSYSDKLELGTMVSEKVVTHKVMNKDGLEYLMCDDDDVQVRIKDTNHHRWTDVEIVSHDYEGDVTIDNYAGFYTMDDMDRFRYNEEMKELQRAVNENPKAVAQYDRDIENLRIEMEEKVKYEERHE